MIQKTTIRSLLTEQVKKCESHFGYGESYLGGGELRLECELLLAKALGLNRSELYSDLEKEVSLRDQQQFFKLLDRRLEGEPIAYILGHKEFWTLDLSINNAVLIPRPETELLVETLFDYLPKLEQNVRILDLGTGSGAIGLAIASSCPHWDIYASDHSLEALNLAKKNAQDLNIKNIRFYSGDWYSALSNEISCNFFNAIISNPPYIAENDPHLLQGDLRYEPKMALVSGNQGLKDLKQIIEGAPDFLAANGLLLVEQGFDQAQSVAELMKHAGLMNIVHHKDLAGVNRVTVGHLKVRRNEYEMNNKALYRIF